MLPVPRRGVKVRITRRMFLTSGTLSTAALLTQSPHHPLKIQARPALDPNTLAPFVDPLPIPAIARSREQRPSPTNPNTKIPYYRLAMRPFEMKVHRDLQPTKMWGFESVFPGPTLESRTGQEMLVEWANELPPAHFLPIDHSIHGAESDKPDVRAVVHLHGGKVPPESDGYPEDWTVPGKSRIYRYPNEQDAALLWYHDHTLGINRLNVFAGLAGMYLLRDDLEDHLHLPSGKFEILLVICDRMLDKQSQLYYPVSDNPQSPWIPEFFGDAHLVNGKLFPFLEVQPRKYRFRMLNAANGRFYRLSLSNQQTFQQIGTDQGLLPAPVTLAKIMIAPAERIDLVIDFSPHAGEKIELHDDVVPLMQFRVSTVRVKDDSVVPPALRPLEKLPESSAANTRMLSLDEVDDLVQNPVKMLLNGAHWNMPVTENPTLNTVEIWTLINPTNDSHPIHLHLVRFQILDRRRIEPFAFLSRGQLQFTGALVPPDPSEAGWKDTVRAEPAMVTRIIARFEGFPGRYVWHCHILEHEDNEMMRPFDVLPAP